MENSDMHPTKMIEIKARAVHRFIKKPASITTPNRIPVTDRSSILFCCFYFL
ncbi:MAG: hypothetical protein IPO62_15375 [Saprospiraceae bacterium]|nr:hypothetical protein [Saprospiraceae bacterium]